MVDDQCLIIDSTVENAFSQILPHQPVLSSHEQRWNGIKIEHHCQPAHETPEHFHQQHVLVIVTKCSPLKVERRLDGNFHSSYMRSGEAFLLPAATHHKVWIHGEAEYTALALEPELMTSLSCELIDDDHLELVPQHQIHDSLIYSLGLALLELLCDQVCVREAGTLCHRVSLAAPKDSAGTKCHRPKGAAPEEHRLYAESAANLLAVHLLQRYSTQKPAIRKYKEGLSKARLHQVIEYINAHLTENLSLQKIANAIGMSQYHFSRMFKQSTGLTPWQYVTQCRLQTAKQLLEKQLSIAEISDRLGFANQQQLTKFFRKHTGLTPTNYRKLL